MAKRNLIVREEVGANLNFPYKFITTFEKDSLFALLGFGIITQFSAYKQCQSFYNLLMGRIEYARGAGLDVSDIIEVIKDNPKAGSEKVFDFNANEVNEYTVRIIVNFFRQFACLIIKTTILKDRIQNSYPMSSDLIWTMLERVCDVFHFALGFLEFGQEPKFFSRNKELEFPLLFLVRDNNRKYSLLLHGYSENSQSFKLFYPVIVDKESFDESKNELHKFSQIMFGCY